MIFVLTFKLQLFIIILVGFSIVFIESEDIMINKNSKKLVSLILSASIVTGLTTTTFCSETPANSNNESSIWEFVPEITIDEETLVQSADKIVQDNTSFFINEYSKIKRMSLDELNTYINNLQNGEINKQTAIHSQQLIQLLLLKLHGWQQLKPQNLQDIPVLLKQLNILC